MPDQLPEGWSLVAYRVGALETKLDSVQHAVLDKLEEISKGYNGVLLAQATQQSELNSLKSIVDRNTGEIAQNRNDLVGLKISLAERVLPGAASGAALATLVEVIRFMVVGH